MCFNWNTENEQVNLHLVDAEEVDHLQSFNQSSSPIQSFIADCLSLGDTRDRHSNSDDSFFVCTIQKQATTMSPQTRLYADLSVSTRVYSKPSCLR